MVPDTSTVDASRCPLCGAANACAMEVQRATGTSQPPCWCLEANFSRELIERVPTAARDQACICAACAAAGR
ncbi:MAG: cysteine-rich CWC family protein [Ramlibacter sp.]